MKKRTNLKFKLSDWPEENYLKLNFSLSPDTFLPLIRTPDIESPKILTDFNAEISMDLIKNRLKIKGTFSTNVEEYCDICLEKSNIEIKGNFSELINLVEKLNPNSDEDDSLSEVLVQNETFDLAPLLSELFWLAWPFTIKCSENCQGLCPGCGENLNKNVCQCNNNNNNNV